MEMQVRRRASSPAPEATFVYGQQQELATERTVRVAERTTGTSLRDCLRSCCPEADAPNAKPKMQAQAVAGAAGSPPPGGYCCISSCCPDGDGDDEYDYYKYCCDCCCGIIQYLHDNIWEPLVNCVSNLLCCCFSSLESQKREVSAFLEKYPNGSPGGNEQFYADYLKLPAAARHRVEATVKHNMHYTRDAQTESYIRENQHFDNGNVFVALRNFVRQGPLSE